MSESALLDLFTDGSTVDPDAVRAAIAAGGRGDRATTGFRFTPAHIAAKDHDAAVLEAVLLAPGSDPMARDVQGGMPAGEAIRGGRDDNLRILLRSGTLATARDRGDATLVAVAASWHAPSLDLLLSSGGVADGVALRGAIEDALFAPRHDDAMTFRIIRALVGAGVAVADADAVPGARPAGRIGERPSVAAVLLHGILRDDRRRGLVAGRRAARDGRAVRIAAILGGGSSLPSDPAGFDGVAAAIHDGVRDHNDLHDPIATAVVADILGDVAADPVVPAWVAATALLVACAADPALAPSPRDASVAASVRDAAATLVAGHHPLGMRLLAALGRDADATTAS